MKAIEILLMMAVGSLLGLGPMTTAQAAPVSQITLYVYPPTKPLNWQSPGTLLSSFAGGEIAKLVTPTGAVDYRSDFQEDGQIAENYRSSMGHTIAHVRCELPNGSMYERWTSLSGQDFREVDKKNLLQDQIGVGVLMENYKDGHIISGEENVKRLVHYVGSRDGREVKPRYMSFMLDPERCENLREMISFFESFHFPKSTTLAQLEKKNPEQLLYFTNMIDPYTSYVQRRETGRGLVGGGCAPYGAALLKIAGVYRPEFEKTWVREVQVSEALIGNRKDRKVSVTALLFGSLGQSWQHQGYANRRVKMYDPQNMYDFLGEAMGCARGAGCKGTAGVWVKSSQGRVRTGAMRSLKGHRTVYERGDDGSSVSRVESISQDMDGLTISL